MSPVRGFVAALLLLACAAAQAAPDYAREKRWADEVVPGIVVGDAVFLELGSGRKFLALLTEPNEPRAALIVVHGLGIHPDWGLVGTLRTGLADRRYTTLSVQMPVLAATAAPGEYRSTFPEAVERIARAVDYLGAKGYGKIAIVSHSMGSTMTREYLRKDPSRVFAWASLGNVERDAYSGLVIPLLDLFGENDLPNVLGNAPSRAASLAGNAKSRQLKIPATDHFFKDREAAMIEAVAAFLAALP
ncbi:MAG TPA: alpha/beta fold hydrolase [Burkholderiaceae bacterium]